MYQRLLNPWRRYRRRRLRRAYLEQETNDSWGLHGDRYLQLLGGCFLERSAAFIETGSAAGSTALFVGRRFEVEVYSCEPDTQAFRHAVKRCAAHKNIHIEQKQSPDFLYELFHRQPGLAGKRLLFWLDAHDFGFRWPLFDEVRFITATVGESVLMIDDFKVPGEPQFGYDEYAGQVCGLDYIRPALAPREYQLILPVYTDRTSAHHGLRGVGTLCFGGEELKLPRQLEGKFSIETIEV